MENAFHDKVKVLHLKQTDKWVIPDNQEIILVDEDQILDRNISVIYYGILCRIEISKKQTK